MDEVLIGTREAAKRTGLSRVRIVQLCQDKMLEAKFISNVWLIREESVNMFLTNRKEKDRTRKSRRDAHGRNKAN